MAGGRTCIILCLPFLMTLASLVLTAVVLVSNARSGAPAWNLYFLRLDVTGITKKAFNASSLTNSGFSTTLVDSSIQKKLSKYGFQEVYTAGLWGHCEGSWNNKSIDFSECSKAKAAYWFDTQSVLQDSLNGTNVKVQLPTTVTRENNKIRVVSKVAFIAYIASAVFLGLTFITGFFTFHSRMASCCAALISLMAFILSLIASAATSSVFIVLKSAFNNNSKDLGIVASLNSTTLGISWGATIGALFATVWWLLTICCGSTTKKREPEKEPFIPNYNYGPPPVVTHYQ